ncbi:hypothetical protein KR222_001983 [Zaprionus bogoriensis]|nr:hypothetical protein KR222_001983 [Zaprionus bogoriensis]
MQQSVKLVTLLLIAIVGNCIVLAAPSRHVSATATEYISEQDQLERCRTYEDQKKYPETRLLLTWHSAYKPGDPLQYLRDILSNDLGLANLVYRLQRVQELPGQLLFELPDALSTYNTVHNFCKVFTSVAEYRQQGYDDAQLQYDISATERDFHR